MYIRLEHTKLTHTHTHTHFTSLTVKLIKKLIKNVSMTDKTACV